jgi:hypothetical protein
VITQKMKQGENEIRIESAESLEDGKEHGFRIDQGEYTRYFVNDKPISSYMILMKFMVEETKKNKEKFIPNKQELAQARMNLILETNESLKKHIQEIKAKHGHVSMPKETIATLDAMIEKIDESGMRIRE